MVGNCNKFHYIGKGNTCGQITSYHRITQEQFARWNPKIGSNCTSLWPDHYACVGVDVKSLTPVPTPSSIAPSNGIETLSSIAPSNDIETPSSMVSSSGIETPSSIASSDGIGTPSGIASSNGVETPSSIASSNGVETLSRIALSNDIETPSRISPSNGIETPQPTQPEMVSNCNQFHYIWKGNRCWQITSYRGITQQQFARWNPKVGLQCGGLKDEAYACVGVLEDVPTPTSPNGIETSQPIQPNMGNACWQVTSHRGITQQQLARWNPKVGLQCDGLKDEAYACVGVLEDVPTPTSPNGIETPQPIQPDMVSNCNQFHYIWKGNACWQVTSHRGITQEQFAEWNPKVGLECDGLSDEAYACVGVLEAALTPGATAPSNGIETPQPTQPDMVSNLAIVSLDQPRLFLRPIQVV
ncbi:LysM domain-containing protein [Beauveria bassiana]|uniref:LysM domain-containing protein n=1 Tax=Beauveria bassiana TaxID=176275 RepID=A0A2N6NNM3_BEABA|nr:LysM domain-containing protein [Beauveria bassiana]